MSVPQQDRFIDDDEEETCPLCVEEFDLGDKSFRPCPCQYQVCFFCYNSIKNNMNGLCPACRRPYNDADIEYKVISPEEQAAHKARQAQKAKKTQAEKQKEKQKTEADNLSRKHLAGLRVVQKNLVYVTGLNPNLPEDDLHQTLRGDQYFGQYGKIIKIVISTNKDSFHPRPTGVYVTFERKEDAASCIAAVDGTKNEGRTLRAQFGTTKYCSAYLRGDVCSNRSCMFLHEPGEANESYSRADLSALNAGSSQQAQGRPPPQSQQPVASASQPMTRQGSADQAPETAINRPALPSTASWASKPPQTHASRAESRSTSGTVDSPAPVTAIPVASQPEATPAIPEQPQAPEPLSTNTRPARGRRRELSPLSAFLKGFNPDDLRFTFSDSVIPPADLEIINSYPPLFDPNGGARRRLRRQREEEQRRMEQEVQTFQQPPTLDHEENPELGGSLQLGGEPEERQGLSQPQSAIQPPGQDGLHDTRFQFGGMSSPGISERGLTPQQHQHMLLQSMKSSNAQGSYINQQSPFQQQSNPPGHHRNASRYSFANDSSSSTTVKPVASVKLLNQQSAIMPQSSGNHFGAQHQQHGSQFYTSNVQGPPPGLKTTGTPPVSGGMTFGQGHGFATGGIQYGANASGRSANEEMMRDLLRGRGSGADTAKHDADFPPLGTPTASRQQSISLDDSRRVSTPPVPPGFEAQAANESRRSTPTIPPGFSKPSALPDLEGGPGSRPGSRAGMKRTTSQIMPALPLRPSTPLSTPAQTPAASTKQEAKDEREQDEVETPTKPPKSAAIAKPVTTAPEVSIRAQLKEAKDENKEPKAEPASLEVSKVRQPSKSKQVETAPAAPVAPVTTDSNARTEAQKQKAPAPAQKSVPAPVQPIAKGEVTSQSSDATVTPFTYSKAEASKGDTQKKKHPGKLDITAAVNKTEPAAVASGNTAETDKRIISQPPSAVPKSDSPAGGLPSPAVNVGPKTLRVVQTPKVETPPANLPAPKDSIPAAVKTPSRQPSLASINVPGTPLSEQVSISDNASVHSASQSRANSPPPAAGKVGSAPVRAKTKAQQKRERQERAKAIEEEKSKTEEMAPAAPEEPAQEAIVSRKKKSKKEKETKSKAKAPAVEIATGESTPTASRPVSPQAKAAPEIPAKTEQPAKEAKASTPSTPTAAAPPRPPPTMSPNEPSPPSTPTLTAAQLLAELKATAPEIQKCIDSLFRSPASNHYKLNQNILPKDLHTPATWKDFDVSLSKDEVEALLKGTAPAIRYGGADGRVWDRGLVTPSGAHLRALTEELELRFLELEKAIRELPEELRFRPSKPQNEMKFPNLDLEALKRQYENAGGRGVSVMEQMVQDGSTMKKGAFLVDEASKYINEFVMPPATPPPSAGGGGNGNLRVQQAAAGAQGTGAEQPPPSVDIAERQLNEARRVADERDTALKKIIKKNKKLLGLG